MSTREKLRAERVKAGAVSTMLMTIFGVLINSFPNWSHTVAEILVNARQSQPTIEVISDLPDCIDQSECIISGSRITINLKQKTDITNKLKNAKEILSKQGSNVSLSCGDMLTFSQEESASLFTLSVVGDATTLLAIKEEVCESAFLVRGLSDIQSLSIIQTATYNQIEDAWSIADVLNQVGLTAEVGVYFNGFQRYQIQNSGNNNSLEQPITQENQPEHCWNVSIPATGSQWCDIEDNIL